LIQKYTRHNRLSEAYSKLVGATPKTTSMVLLLLVQTLSVSVSCCT